NVGGTAVAVAVGDLLGNGVQDIVVANANGTVNVLLSNGNGTFQVPKSFAGGATPVAIGVADFNGDGKRDIVTANASGTLSVLAGNGKGTCQNPITTQVGGVFTSLAVGDLNGDRRPDLVVGTSIGLDSLLGNGNGTFSLKQTVSFARVIDGIVFQSSVNSLLLSDLRSDGKLDIVALASGGINVLLGNSDGTFTSPVPLNTGQSTSAAFVIGDFDGNGKPDIASCTNAGYQGAPTLLFLAGNGDGTFHAPKQVGVGETANSLAAGDFRGNGKLDLVMAAQGSDSLTLVQGNGNGTFAIAPSFPIRSFSSFIAAGDFNGDGRPDLVVASTAVSASVFLNNGNGTFRAGSVLVANGGGPVVVADFNGDGKQDVAVSTGSAIDVFL